MAASLAEAEAAKRAELPLEERPPQEIQQVCRQYAAGRSAAVLRGLHCSNSSSYSGNQLHLFCGLPAPCHPHRRSPHPTPLPPCREQEFAFSQLLPALAAHFSLESLLEPPLRLPLIEFLKLEKV